MFQSERLGFSSTESEPAVNPAMKRNVQRPPSCYHIGELFGILLVLLAATVNAEPSIAFPINSQVPPVARVSESYHFTFSTSTFASSLSSMQYSLTNSPDWLQLDSSSRTFSGTPQTSDAGSVDFFLVAADPTGSTSMPVTFVVSTDPGPGLGLSVAQQLPTFGTFAAPDILLIYPSSLLLVSFGSDTFTNTDETTVYYAICANNTPLPSWISFDTSSLSLTGTTPEFTSPSELPQQFVIELTASDVVGFSGAIVSLQLVVTDHKLTYSNSTTTIGVVAGKPVQSLVILDRLTIDGKPVQLSDIKQVVANPPAWLTINTATFVLSGLPPLNVNSQSFPVSVFDVYGDIANMTIYIETASGNDLIQGSIGTIQAYMGSNFTYTFSVSQFSDPIPQIDVSLGNTSSWLHFDSDTLTLAGRVPADIGSQEDQIKITATSGGQSQSQWFTITLLASGSSSSTGVVSYVIPANTATSTTPTTSSTQVQPNSSIISRGQPNPRIVAAIIAVPIIVFIAIILLWLLVRKMREKRSYLDEARVEISRPSLQRQDDWEEPLEPSEKVLSSHRRIPSQAPKIEMRYDNSLPSAPQNLPQSISPQKSNRQSATSKGGSIERVIRDILYPYDGPVAERPESTLLPETSIVNENVAWLRELDGTHPTYARSALTRRRSQSIILLPPASYYSPGHLSCQSCGTPGPPFRRLSRFGHSNASSDLPFSRSSSRQFKVSSRTSSSFGFGHGKGRGSFDRLSSGPPGFNQVRRSWRNTKSTSQEHIRSQSKPKSTDSTTIISALGSFPRPPISQHPAYASAMLEDSTSPLTPSHKIVSQVTTPAKAYTPGRPHHIQKFLQARRSQRESVFFSARPSKSRKLSRMTQADNNPIAMSPHAESEVADRYESSNGSSSNKENRCSADDKSGPDDGSNSFFKRTSNIIGKNSSAYRKGLMMQRAFSTTSSHTANSRAASSQCLPSAVSKYARAQDQPHARPVSRACINYTTPIASPRIAKKRFTSHLDLQRLRLQTSMASLTSSQRYGSAMESEGERADDLLGESDFEDSSRVWTHALLPNPLGEHGKEGREERGAFI